MRGANTKRRIFLEGEISLQLFAAIISHVKKLHTNGCRWCTQKLSVRTESLLPWELWFSVIHCATTERGFCARSYILLLFAVASTGLVNMHLAMVKIVCICGFTFIHPHQGFS